MPWTSLASGGPGATTTAVVAAALAAAAVLLALGPPGGRGRPSPSGADAAGPPLERAGSGAWVPAVAGVAAGAVAWVFVSGWPGIPAAVAAAGLAARAARRLEPRSARRRRDRLRRQLPSAVDLLAACFASGRAPAEAVGRIGDAMGGPVADELGRVSARLHLGVDPVTVWSDLGRHPELGAVGRALARASERGASVADAMNRLADDLRRDAGARAQARARAVGVRAALPLGVCMLPAFVLLAVVPLVAGSVSSLLP